MDMPAQFLNNQLSDQCSAIADQIMRVLQDQNRSAFKNLHVDSTGGVVTLRGNTRSFYERQIALTHSMSVVGDCQLIDEIVVQRE